VSRLSVNHLVRRGTTYYFRARVPTEIRDSFLGIAEVKISLRTEDFQYAKRLCRCLSNAFEVLSARIGQMKFLTVPEVHGFVRTYFQHSLNQALELSHDIPQDPQEACVTGL
jgi:hypothetical protein